MRLYIDESTKHKRQALNTRSRPGVHGCTSVELRSKKRAADADVGIHTFRNRSEQQPATLRRAFDIAIRVSLPFTIERTNFAKRDLQHDFRPHGRAGLGRDPRFQQLSGMGGIGHRESY